MGEIALVETPVIGYTLDRGWVSSEPGTNRDLPLDVCTVSFWTRGVPHTEWYVFKSNTGIIRSYSLIYSFVLGLLTEITVQLRFTLDQGWENRLLKRDRRTVFDELPLLCCVEERVTLRF